MDGVEKTEHIPAIFEIGPPLKWEQAVFPWRKKNGRSMGENPYLNIVPRLNLRF